MKKYLMILTAAVMVLMLAACGSSSEAPSQDEAPAGEQEPAAEEEETAAPEVNPYAWLGFQDIPECDYMDALASNHYYKKSEVHIDGLSYVSKQINAVDGINTYKEDENSKVWSVGGKILSLNESSKSYMEEDMSDMAEDREEIFSSAMEEGTNLYGREFRETGKEVVPIQEDDKEEYEYYEYYYPEMEESSDNATTERYYLKDGDVFAIYTKAAMGETVVESTEIIKKMTSDIPDGTFDLPDVSGYEKIEY